MRCINKRGIGVLCLLTGVLCLSAGCSGKSLPMAYDVSSNVSAFSMEFGLTEEKAEAFAADLCVASADMGDESLDMSKVTAAGLFDVSGAQTLYAKNVHKVLNPASLTKVMTALVALKYGQPDDIMTASENVIITESGAQLIGIKPGDKMTLDQALHALLMYSANDAGVLIAENISGSVDAFAQLMTEEAKKIGATNSNFTNPHGLTDDQHYTTAYDLYLIFNEAIKNDLFVQIIQMTSYSTTYQNSAGEPVEMETGNTNLYLSGEKQQPTGAVVLGGKTGTTKAAKSCLVLLSKDASGKPYISVMLQAETRDDLYVDMTELLNEIGK